MVSLSTLVAALAAAATTTLAVPTTNIASPPGSFTNGGVNGNGTTSPELTFTPAASDQSTCNPSTFSRNNSNGGSGIAADWRHCAALYSSLASKNGTYTLRGLSGAAFLPLIQTKSCVVGVRAGSSEETPITMGDKDLKAILDTALNAYSDGTELQVEGDVACEAGVGAKGTVHWQIYGGDA